MKSILGASLLTLILMAPAAFAAGQFEGMTAEQLFPGAENDEERKTAFDALMKTDLPDLREKFKGKKITMGVLGSGPRGGISGPVYFWREAFQKATGATLDIVELPFGEFLTNTVADFANNQNTYDLLTPGGWFYGDYIQGGYIQPIDQFLDNPDYPKWDREAVAPGIKELMKWDGKWYGSRYDGDAQILYYRKDILANPKWKDAFKSETGKDLADEPKTWQELIDITKFFNGKDWNEDGDPDNGIALHLKGNGFGAFHFMSLSAAFAVEPGPADNPTKVDDNTNVYWFDPKDMKPLINQPGHVAALEYLIELAKTGSPSQVSWDLSEAWNDFLNGNAIATFSWGDLGSLAQSATSKVKGKLGAAAIPCSTTWYSRSQAKMITDEANPNCIGNVNGGSWHPVMSSRTKEPELSYYLMAMLASPHISFWNVAYGWTGVDIGSTADLFPPRGTATPEQYAATGYNLDDAKEFVEAYGDQLFAFKTVQGYLRIPGTPAYWQALDTRLASAMSGQATAKEALDSAAADWETITDDNDRENQLKLYRDAIGYAQ